MNRILPVREAADAAPPRLTSIPLDTTRRPLSFTVVPLDRATYDHVPVRAPFADEHSERHGGVSLARRLKREDVRRPRERGVDPVRILSSSPPPRLGNEPPRPVSPRRVELAPRSERERRDPAPRPFPSRPEESSRADARPPPWASPSRRRRRTRLSNRTIRRPRLDPYRPPTRVTPRVYVRRNTRTHPPIVRVRSGGNSREPRRGRVRRVRATARLS